MIKRLLSIIFIMIIGVLNLEADLSNGFVTNYEFERLKWKRCF